MASRPLPPTRGSQSFANSFLNMLGNSSGRSRDTEEEMGVDTMDIDTEQVQPDVEIDEAAEACYYYDADNSNSKYMNKHRLMLKDNFRPDRRPRLKALVDTCIRERDTSIMFEQGMWVEYLSNDMKWKIGIVNRVIKQPPDDWDFEADGDVVPDNRMIVSYNVGVEGLISHVNVRAPRKGLETIFGKRPWLWQQFTLLQLEKRLRFDEGHEYDFEEVDNVEFGKTRFDLWLNAKDNKDFKELYDQQRPVTQKLLLGHLMTPFELCDFITERKEEWDFDDEDISVYTYLSVMGEGTLVVLIVLFVQILAPLLIMYNTVFLSDGDPNPRFDTAGNFTFLPSTTLDLFCSRDGILEGKIMLVIVVIIYFITIVPDTFLNFFRTSGGASTTFSKINSLRQIIWDQNDDDSWQQIGFKLDRMMNTGYVVLLYLCMLFVLINTPLVLDIILNALAIEFIHAIDERVANAGWWDGNNRYIKAGTLELVMQSSLRLRVLEDGKRLCDEYDIDYDRYKLEMGDGKGLKDIRCSLDDSMKPKFMTKKEIAFMEVAQAAMKKKNRFLLNEYKKRHEQFGLFSAAMRQAGIRRSGIFARNIPFRCWSRWHRIMFLPRLPDEGKRDKDLQSRRAANVLLGMSDVDEFYFHIFHVLSGGALIASVFKSLKHGKYMQSLLRVFLGISEAFFYLAQILFPFVMLACLLLVPFCY